MPAPGSSAPAAERVRAAEGAVARARAHGVADFALSRFPRHGGQTRKLARRTLRRAMQFSIYQESRRGARKSNQDRIAYCYTRDALLMLVADGMGGHLHGEIAAQIAVQFITAGIPARSPSRGCAIPPPFCSQAPERRPPRDRPARRGRRPGGGAAHHLRRLRRAGQRRLLGARRRFAPVPYPRRRRILAQTARPLAGAAADRQRAHTRRRPRQRIRSATGSTTASARRAPPQVDLSERRRCTPATSCCCAPTACGVRCRRN